jgi:hypothetical protein
MLAKGAGAVAAALDRTKAPLDVVGLAFAESSNALVLARYLEYKVAASPLHSTLAGQLDEVSQWLSRRLKVMVSRAGDGLKSVQRYTEPSVLHALEHTNERSVRPESRHRREIPCQFSSFEGMHTALAPPSSL